MHIDAVEVYHAAMPLISPWRTAYGEDAAAETLMVRMRSGDHAGWGESTPLAAPCYSPEWAGGAFACIRDWLAPAVVGERIESGDALQDRLARFKGNPFAKAALDNAWWNTHALSEGKPLHQLIGPARETVEVGADFGVMDSIDDLLQAMGTAFDEGFRRVKLKFRPGWDLMMLRAVRTEFPDQLIHIDCNSAFNLDCHFEMFCRLDDFMLEMIEQPLGHDDLYDHARLQESIQTPICLDESVNSVQRARQAIDMESCRWMNVKPGRVGGLTNALKIHDLCLEAGVRCWVGGMLESALGASLCIALATKENFVYPADIFPSSRFYEQDAARPEITLSRDEQGVPHVVPSSEPGLGVEPNLELLQQRAIAHALIE
ncbi:MAG: o-succinylbenzoate synthase [Planctomycetales bacterium]